MRRQFILSVLALFVLLMGFGILIHGLLLKDDYSAMPHVMRGLDETRALFEFTILAYLLAAIGLTWIYRMGMERNKGWPGQGARFGITVAMVSVVPTSLISYTSQRIPEMLAIKQIALERSPWSFSASWLPR